RFAGTRRSERKIFAVGTPARRTLAIVAEGDLSIILTIVAGHPDMRVALVFFCVDGRDGISDPLTIRRDLRVTNVAKAGQVIEFQRMSSGLRRYHGRSN